MSSTACVGFSEPGHLVRASTTYSEEVSKLVAKLMQPLNQTLVAAGHISSHIRPTQPHIPDSLSILEAAE